VYSGDVTQTNIEIEDVGEKMTREEMLAMEGTGWDGDLDEIRSREEIPELSPRPSLSSQ